MIAPEFAVHMLNEMGKQKAAFVAECFHELLSGLSEVCPEGRHFAIAKTKLEEACFFAKKAMASSPENSEVMP